MGDLFTVVSLVAFVVMLVLALRVLRSTVSTTRRTRRWLTAAAGTWIGAFALSILIAPAPSSQAAGRPDGDPQLSVAGYTQTWTKGYSTTTCAEFEGEMTASQRFAAAADMLTLVWMKIEDTSSFPGDTLIAQYRDEVLRRCDVPTETIAAVAWGVWITDGRFAA